MLAASFMFCSLELLDKKWLVPLFHYWVKYYTSDVDEMVAIISNKKKEIYKV